MGKEAERTLLPIVQDPHLSALDKFRRYFAAAPAGKAGRRSGCMQTHPSLHPSKGGPFLKENLEMATKTKRAPIGTFLVSFVITALAFPGIILLLGGDWLWPEGWLFSLWFDAMVLFSAVYMYMKDPALLVVVLPYELPSSGRVVRR